MQHERDMFLYAWDVIDEGARPMAQRLSALGVTSVSLAAVYHSGKLLLPHNPKRCVLVLEDNRSYFPSDPGRYGTLRPAESELLRGHNPEFWNEMLHEFHACNIRVCAWVVVFHADRLARMYPEYALHNAWGEPSPHSLCPSGEEAFRYGLSLLEDVAASGVDELHLESAEYGGFLHGAHHEMQAYADCSGLERLLSPCFCPACIERAQRGGVDAERLREALASFEGVKRRFEFYVNTPRQVYMDDYAHHPRELAAAITSVKKMFPGRRLTALFQPHLYTRTRDFYREFAEALSHADRVVLLPIYPAREEPIPGVESEMIGRLLTVPWTICDRAELAEKVAAMDTDVVVSFGAGNIDACCGALAEKLREKA